MSDRDKKKASSKWRYCKSKNAKPSHYESNKQAYLERANSNYATNDAIYLANLQENIANLVADRIAVQSKKQADNVQHNHYKKAEKPHILTKAEARKQVDESFVFKGVAIPVELYEELTTSLGFTTYFSPHCLNNILRDYLDLLNNCKNTNISDNLNGTDVIELHQKAIKLSVDIKALQRKNKLLQNTLYKKRNATKKNDKTEKT